MLKVGDVHAIMDVSQTVTDQTDMINADSHSFMREKFTDSVLNLQVHRLKIEDASNLSKTRDTRPCPRRVNP